MRVSPLQTRSTEEPEEGAEVRVWGNMVAFLERLDDEHFKSLQVRATCMLQEHRASAAAALQLLQ